MSDCSARVKQGIEATLAAYRRSADGVGTAICDWQALTERVAMLAGDAQSCARKGHAEEIHEALQGLWQKLATHRDQVARQLLASLAFFQENTSPGYYFHDRQVFGLPILAHGGHGFVYAYSVSSFIFLDPGAQRTISTGGSLLPDEGIAGRAAWRHEKANLVTSYSPIDILLFAPYRIHVYPVRRSGSEWDNFIFGRQSFETNCFAVALHTRDVPVVKTVGSNSWSWRDTNSPEPCPHREKDEKTYEKMCMHPARHLTEEYEIVGPDKGTRAGDRVFYLSPNDGADGAVTAEDETTFPYNPNFKIVHVAIVAEVDKRGIPTKIISKFGQTLGVAITDPFVNIDEYGSLFVIARKKHGH